MLFFIRIAVHVLIVIMISTRVVFLGKWRHLTQILNQDLDKEN